jgi:preprotein translocase subunit SecD
MANLLKSWRIWVLFAGIFLAAGLIAFKGIDFGIDFQGGTLFQIHLSEDVNNMEPVIQIIESRLNWSGLKDIRVYGAQNQFVFVIVPETKEEDILRIESLIKKQGNFEVTIDGNVIFTGDGLINVDQGGGGMLQLSQINKQTYEWMLPFMLKMDAAERFRDLSFHKCSLVSFETAEYDCALTYFYMDRPKKSVLVLSQERFDEDKSIFTNGAQKIPSNTSVQDILLNGGAQYFAVSDNALSKGQAEGLKKEFAKGNTIAIVQVELSDELKKEISSLGFTLKEVKAFDAETPWLYTATGLKSIVRLNPELTGNKPYVEKPEDSKAVQDLVIQGTETDPVTSKAFDKAKAERDETKILLNSGSLPVSVESISHFWTSPTQGREFLVEVAIMGFLALVAVSLIIFFRYRQIKLSMAIIFTAIVEAFCTTAFTSALGQSIDIAAIAGIIAAIGTGVNDQIIITDELLKGGTEEEQTSVARRIKRAFFMVIAAAATMLATMFPLIILGGAMVKLVGFAIAVVIGVLVGVLITRPAYGEIARYLMGEY